MGRDVGGARQVMQRDESVGSDTNFLFVLKRIATHVCIAFMSNKFLRKIIED